MNGIRVGLGFDVHQLAEGEEFWIGGILVPHSKGAVGHSDADVLLHAINDAIFGAASLGDIGTHFPDTDAKYKGIDSKILLRESIQLVRGKGYEIGNIDATVSLQLPKLKPHIPKMRETIAEVLNIEIDQISIKATTTEKLGYVGTEDGVNAHAVALLFKK
jgi:2-C-methyl-D-erythritol 2,4-cyclodiphosphate synthase